MNTLEKFTECVSRHFISESQVDDALKFHAIVLEIAPLMSPPVIEDKVEAAIRMIDYATEVVFNRMFAGQFAELDKQDNSGDN